MTHWVKASSAKPYDLSSIPWTRMVEGENGFLQLMNRLELSILKLLA